MIQQIDHIGIAVRDLDVASEYYERALGLSCEGREEVPSQKVKTAFFKTGGVHIELLEPMGEDSPIAKFLEKSGEGIHHIAFRVDDVEAQLKHASDAGVRLIHEVPVDGASDKLVAFLHPKSTHGVLTEFCQPKHESDAH
ncbi:MAG: methylmalonyl-CoA epimerase [Opitutales bacterium]